MTPQHVEILFQLIAFLFAISVHESAHAWMASRRGDPTASMLGRVSLNPIRHIDPVGTVLLPLVAAFTHLPMLGWAKPTPVDPRNFKNPVADDVLTSVAGPVSNFIVASIAVIGLIVVKHAFPDGRQLVYGIPFGYAPVESSSALVPLCLLLYAFMEVNVVLGVFNLIPVPPLDGSHVVRHLLPESALRIYDTVGIFGLMALVFLAPGLLGRLIYPVLSIFNSLLLGA